MMQVEGVEMLKDGIYVSYGNNPKEMIRQLW